MSVVKQYTFIAIRQVFCLAIHWQMGCTAGNNVHSPGPHHPSPHHPSASLAITWRPHPLHRWTALLRVPRHIGWYRSPRASRLIRTAHAHGHTSSCQTGAQLARGNGNGVRRCHKHAHVNKCCVLQCRRGRTLSRSVAAAFARASLLYARAQCLEDSTSG